MKIRADFVTNSSSSSFVSFGVLSEELAEFISELLGGETSGFSDTAVGKLTVDKNIVSLTTTLDTFGDYHIHRYETDERSEAEEEEDNKQVNSASELLELMKGFLPNLREAQIEKLTELLEFAVECKRTVASTYIDETDSFFDRQYYPHDFTPIIHHSKNFFPEDAETYNERQKKMLDLILNESLADEYKDEYIKERPNEDMDFMLSLPKQIPQFSILGIIQNAGANRVEWNLSMSDVKQLEALAEDDELLGRLRLSPFDIEFMKGLCNEPEELFQEIMAFLSYEKEPFKGREYFKYLIECYPEHRSVLMKLYNNYQSSIERQGGERRPDLTNEEIAEFLHQEVESVSFAKDNLSWNSGDMSCSTNNKKRTEKKDKKEICHVCNPEDYLIDGNYGLVKYSGEDACIAMPEEIVAINTDAFLFNKTVKSVIASKNVISILEDAFFGCESLEKIILPESLTDIGNRAFHSCSSLKTIVIPDRVKRIGPEVFLGCDNLVDIYVPASVQEIGESAFDTINDYTAIHTPSGSFAHQYAKENGLKVDHKNPPEQLEPPVKKLATSLQIEMEDEAEFVLPEELEQSMSELKKAMESMMDTLEELKGLDWPDEDDEIDLYVEDQDREERYDQLIREIQEQNQIISENKALFGAKAKARKDAKEKLEELQRQLNKEFPNGRP